MGSSPLRDALPLHVVLFPFMSKGHTIPIVDFARLLLIRRPDATVTLFTTPANRPFVSSSLSDTAVTVLDLPFPGDIPAVPPGIESTDKLPSISLFVPFAVATRRMQPDFEASLRSLPPVTLMVTDAFLGWTLATANKLNIPRFVHYGMSNFAVTVTRNVVQTRALMGPDSDDDSFAVPAFPWLKLTRNDFEPPFTDREPKGEHYEFVAEQAETASRSYGMIVNSFHELEPVYSDYWNSEFASKSWSVGPLCLAQPRKNKPESQQQTPWIQWLDRKEVQGSPVLYAAFGSQAEISPEQFEEIKTGLYTSEVNFLWVVRGNQRGLDDGFEEKVKERGVLVREWVDQRKILSHPGVTGFLSHCGWNSVIESLCACVPILAWPIMAEQHLNARMLVEELQAAIRVETVHGGVRGFVRGEGLARGVKMLMAGEKGREARTRAGEIGRAAAKAMQEGGSSLRTVDMLLAEVQGKRTLPA